MIAPLATSWSLSPNYAPNVGLACQTVLPTPAGWKVRDRRMLSYFCASCQFYYQEAELLTGKRCPQCRGEVKPRVVLGGQVMGDA